MLQLHVCIRAHLVNLMMKMVGTVDAFCSPSVALASEEGHQGKIIGIIFGLERLCRKLRIATPEPFIVQSQAVGKFDVTS